MRNKLLTVLFCMFCWASNISVRQAFLGFMVLLKTFCRLMCMTKAFHAYRAHFQI
jgi:hypothetical protein